MGIPTYVTLTSSGSSPWISVNYHTISDINIGIAIRTNALSSNWQIDVTMDDPFGTYPSSAGPTVFQSSQVGGISGGSSNSIGAISNPIAAFRLTTSSTGGAVTMTALQAGIG